MQYTIRDECSRARRAQISAIVEALAKTVGSSEYRIRYKRPTTLTFADARPKLGAVNLFIAGWIKDHFLNEISFMMRAVTERLLKKLKTARLGLTISTLLEEKDMK